MSSFLKRTLADLLFVAVLLAIAYYYRAPLSNNIHKFIDIVWPTTPCTQPIIYSLGTVDKQFGTSQAQFLDAIARAENVWDSELTRNLFKYSTTSPDITINLVYDYRQQTTQKLDVLGGEIKSTRASYDELRTKYTTMTSQFEQRKTTLTADMSNYKMRKNEYDRQVSYWNDRGGAPKKEYDRLESERKILNTIATELNDRQVSLNELVRTINMTAQTLNRLATDLNIDVKTYNTVGASTGEEFSEAEYVEDEKGKRINVYQFNDRNQLIRVLEHELGHALGLDHVNNPRSIMYRLNEGTNEKLTPEDISELKRVCRLQ